MIIDDLKSQEMEISKTRYGHISAALNGWKNPVKNKFNGRIGWGLLAIKKQVVSE